MTKNIWYISKYSNILKYGANSRQFSFCKEFNKLGFKSTLITGNSYHQNNQLPRFRDKYMHEVIEGVDIIWINLPQYEKATSLKRFWTWIQFEYKVIKLSKNFPVSKPNFIIGSSLSFLTIISASYLKWKHKAKYIFEVRDIWPQTLFDLKGLSKYNPVYVLLRLLEKFGYKNADHIVGTMPGLYKHVERSINEKGKVTCIPQGLDLEFYTKKQESLDEIFIERYFPKSKFTITYAGTLGISYALDKVIEAAAKINKTYPDIHFLFLGDGIEKKKLMNQAKELSNVTFVPRIRKQQVLDFLSRSSILLHSFQMKKVFDYGISPNKFIDYMYSARPIIVMFSGYPSLINEANCGEFIPSEDIDVLIETILRYYKKDPGELNKIGENGKNYLINNLTFEKLANNYIDLF